MELSFVNKAIRGVCEDEDDAKAKFGLAVAKELQSRLADIDAAVSIKDLIVGRPTQIDDGMKYKIDLADGYILVFSANHVKNPQVDGKINWAEVRRVKVLEIIKDYE